MNNSLAVSSPSQVGDQPVTGDRHRSGISMTSCAGWQQFVGIRLRLLRCGLLPKRTQ